jgi:hypothetical protein
MFGIYSNPCSSSKTIVNFVLIQPTFKVARRCPPAKFAVPRCYLYKYPRLKILLAGSEATEATGRKVQHWPLWWRRSAVCGFCRCGSPALFWTPGHASTCDTCRKKRRGNACSPRGSWLMPQRSQSLNINSYTRSTYASAWV